LRSLAQRLAHLASPVPEVVNPTPPAYRVGDQTNFWVSNTDTLEHFLITATLRAQTAHAQLWVENEYPIDQDALEQAARYFEEHIYPTDRAMFGSEWSPGVDNDVHLILLHTHDLGSSILGYFSATDEFSRLVNPYSNEREMFYLNLDYLQPDTPSYYSTLAHEFQHMIHWAHDRNEDSWVNEGLSTLAELVNGYGRQNAIFLFPEQPDMQLTTWPEEGTGIHYEASYLFMTYLWERFGDEAIRALVDEPRNGEAGVEATLARLGYSMSFSDLFADWVIANYLDDPTVEDGRYSYRSLDMPSLSLAATHHFYPVHETGTVHQYGTDYIELEPHKGRANYTDFRITFQGSFTVPLVPTAPASGRCFWWSNRADNSDMTLTRAFDLRGLSQATLQFQLWYDIEEGWDYAYVEISTDGGQTWDILSGRHTTTYDPNAYSFGPAYTGCSGGSCPPQWVQEEMDLTPYVGQEVLLRFEYVTDDAVNKVGLALDDITIPELGYRDDVEGASDWQAQGFVRTDNTLPQRFLVQLIEMGDRTRVRRMKLDDAKRGELTLNSLGTQVERAILVISALAPLTTEEAQYEYAIVPLRK